ncbi:DUF7657 domain-containing protein [Paenibacillus tyrfis]|uniref:DUF7657 domain-containing protein n=1 Tax=Paenibacillus tyrfis TaxID=1501230 RepID=UPI000B587D8F|nr:hypothetical protein [Paenibacillus tyrfis]
MALLKKKSYIIIFLLLLAVIIELLFANYNYFRVNLFSHDLIKNQTLDINSAQLTNVKKNGNLYITENNDPQVEFKQLNKKVNNIELNLKYENPGTTLQIFYTTPTIPNYSEEHSIKVPARKEQENYTINFPSSEEIINLRIDLSNLNNDNIQFNSITLNKEQHFFSFSISRLFLLFLVILILYSLAYHIVKYNSVIFKYRYALAFLIFLLLVLSKIHVSSIGLWDNFISNKNQVQSTTLVGKGRDIRSDEFLVHTPWVLAQNENENFFPIRNLNIGSNGHSMIALNAPTLSPDIIGKPYFWGFLLLGKDYGLSWYWNFKIIMLLLLSFEICLFLTRNKFLSLVGAFWIALSPSIQWWFDTPAAVVELIILAQGMIVSGIYFFKHYSNTRYRILSMILFTMSAIGFTTLLYPPLQVSLGYLVLIFWFFMIYDNKKKLFIINKYELITAVTCFVVLLISIGSFIYYSLNDFMLLTKTKYPGDRFVTGGSINITDLQTYLINWLLPFKNVNFSNSSELSNYYNFLPLILLVFFRLYKYEKYNKKLIVGLYCYLLFQVSWLFVVYPKFFAKISFFSYVTEKRLAYMVLGLTSVYISIWLASIVEKNKPFRSIEKIGIVTLIGIVYFYSIWHTDMLKYLTIGIATLTIVYFLSLNYLLLSGRVRIFGTIFLILIFISGVTVNPISRGTESLYEKPITKKVLEIKKQYPNEKWGAANSIFNGQLLVSLGINTFNSVHFYPDMNMWKKLDPDGKYEDIYNRYAHVLFMITEEKTNFKLMQQDVMQVNVNLQDIPITGISFILSKGSLERYKQHLEEIYYDQENDIYIYKIIKGR